MDGHWDYKPLFVTDLTWNNFKWISIWKLYCNAYSGKTKSILFSKEKSLMEINIFVRHFIKQQDKIPYLVCQIDSKLSGEAMASKVLTKKNAKK